MGIVKKRKKTEREKLKEECKTLCHLFVRTRDGNRCITCGRHATGSGYQAGHFIPACICGDDLKYDEENVNGQCYHCNINLGGLQAVYERKLIQKIGKARVNRLWRIYRQSKNQWTDDHFRERCVL